MKLMCVSVLRWNHDTDDAVLLDGAFNLDEYNFFQKGSVKEFMAFASKTVMKRTGGGISAVDYEGNMLFAVVQADGLGAIVMADKEYAPRVAVALAKEVLAAFKGAHAAAAWRAARADYACRLPALEGTLREYQDPTKVDKVLRLDKQLGETKDILVKTIEKVLERGEKLDELVDKSAALSAQSKMFYKQAKKTNACCAVM